MPSWRLHRLVANALTREVEGFAVWTPNAIDKIDKIIDEDYGEHDLGRGPDPDSFHRLLRALWLEFGDVYDPEAGRLLRTSYGDRARLEQEVLARPELQYRYMIYVPDDVLVLALLHHILDLSMDFLLNNDISADESALMIEYARQKMKEYGIPTQLGELRTVDGRTFDEVLEWLLGVLRERSRWLYSLMVGELRSKGLGPGQGPKALARLLAEFVRSKGYYGIVYVNGRWLPTAAAANFAFNELRKGKGVVLGFTIPTGPGLPPSTYIYEEVRASSLRELVEKLSKAARPRPTGPQG